MNLFADMPWSTRNLLIAKEKFVFFFLWERLTVINLVEGLWSVDVFATSASFGS